MDFGEGSTFYYIIPIVVLIVLSFVLRRRRGGGTEQTPVDIAGSLLFDVRENQKVVGAVGTQMRPKKLKNDSWRRNEAKLDFLDTSLRNTLSETFNLAEDYNMQVDAAKRFKSTSYISVINVDRLKRSLSSSNQGLEEWLRANMEQGGPTQQQQRPGCLFGG